MIVDTPGLAPFLERQLRDFGGHVEVDAGLWALFGVEAGDQEANALARLLLTCVAFAYDTGHTEDERWILYYVDSANRPAALHWLDDCQRQVNGDIRLPSPGHRRWLDELAEAPMPHRVAQKLADAHDHGALSAGSINGPKHVRALLDRLHLREPLFYAAFQLLLEHGLIDMLVLLQQLIAEDVALLNETLKGSLSRDPFVQSRQDAAAKIRQSLIEFSVINSLDQQKAAANNNPYAAYMDLLRRGEELLLPLDGTTARATPADFVRAIRAIRRQIYFGGDFGRFDTQAPWMSEDIALSFRFIKRRLEAHRDLRPLDGLYMLERAAHAE